MGLADEEGFPHSGTINSSTTGSTWPPARCRCAAVFDNPTHILSPGLFVRVRLPIGEPYQAILIDEQALGTDQGQKFVYVVDDDNNAQYRRVEVGKLQNGQRVVRKGIAEGERVVVSGLQRVRPGSPGHGQARSRRSRPSASDGSAGSRAGGELAAEVSWPAQPSAGRRMRSRRIANRSSNQVARL